MKRCSKCGSTEIKAYQFAPDVKKGYSREYVNGYECRNCYHREGDNGEQIPTDWIAD
jgi:hypothetical protein